MSGICGTWSFGHDATDIEPLLSLLERRGPDGTRRWSDGEVALGHTLLATTPEALVEVLPLTDEESGCTITADVRLDNRSKLIADLDLASEIRTVGDGELILRAYLKWGKECPTHLLGDFAFAIWDSRKQRLFCARDHMGMKQFNYCHVEQRLFAFATEDTALLALNEVPKSLNEARLADFIADLEGFDFTSTFFDSIFRLPPAHSMVIDARGCNIRRYWQLRPGPRLRLDSDEAFGAAFLKVFSEAVQCRLRSTGKLGAMLSGGLDSSAVVAVAAGIRLAAHENPLKTFSAIGPDASHCPESIAIQSALNIEGLDPTLISRSDFNGQSAALLSEMKNVRNPFELNGTMLRCVYLTAREKGVNIVLDGGAGDVVLTSGNRIASMISNGQLKRALQEVNGEILFWKPANPVKFRCNVLLSAAWVAFAPMRLRVLRRSFRHTKPLPELKPEIARRVGIANRRRIADKHVRFDIQSEPARRAQSILHPNLTSARERFDQLAGSCGVESRDPFMDIRLIAFCLSLPPEQLQVDGWPKIIMRRAVEELVPRDIAWRRGKEHLGWEFTTALLATSNDWRDSMLNSDSPLKRYLSRSAVLDLCEGRAAPPDSLALRLFALDRFLRRYGERAPRH